MTPDTRVFLRSLRDADAEAIFAYRSDPEVMRYQGWEPRTADEVRAFIASLDHAQPYAPGTWYQLGIALRATDELIGDCGVHVPGDEPRQAEIGITVARTHQGRGLASEALRALLSLLFDALGKHRVFGSIDPRNRRSIALVKRAGFRAEALHLQSVWFRGTWADDAVFAILRSEWIARWDQPGTSG